MPAQAGSAYIPIRPDLTDFHRTIQKELQAALGPIVAQLGKQTGVDLGKGIEQGIGDPLAGPLEESGRKQRSKAPREGDAVGGAFAGAYKRKVTDAFKSLPDVEINADSSAADRKLAELRARLVELSKQTIGVDVDAGTALIGLAAVKRELDELAKTANIQVSADTATAAAKLTEIGQEAAGVAAEHPNITVDADTAAAIAALAATDEEVKKLDGRTAHVDVDTSGATTSIIGLAGRVAGLSALFVGLGSVGAAALLALAPPAAAAGAALGGIALVAVPAISRIKDALDAQQQAQQNSAAAAAQAQGRALAEAAAQQQLAAAVRNAAAAHAQAVAQISAAEQQVAAAQQTAANAQRELTQARLDARRALEDMRNQLTDLSLSVQQSGIDVDRARASLDQMRAAAAAAAQGVANAQSTLAQAQAAQRALAANPGATDAAKAQAAANVAAAQAALKSAQDQKAARDLDARQAQIAYQQAVQRLKERQLQLRRLQQDERAASKAGVDGSQAVLAARQRLAAANQQIANSEQALAAARANVARVDQNSADQIASAQRGIAQAALQGAGANAKLNASMAALSPAARGLMAAWQQLTGAFNVWQASLEPTVLPILARGLGLIQSMLPLITPVVRGAAAAMNTLLTAAQRTFTSPVWKTFAGTLGQLTQSTLTTLGNVALQLATTVARVLNAFAPFAPVILGVITKLGSLISQVVGQLGAMAPSLAPIVGVIGQLAQALGPLLVAALQGLAPVLAGLAPILGAVIRYLQPVISALIAGLRPVLVSLVPVVGLVIGALGQILDALAPILPVLGQFIGSLVSGLVPILTPIISLIARVAAQLAGALITTIRAALPSVQQIVLAIASLLPALMPLIPLFPQWEMAILPLLPPLLRLVAIIVQLLVPVLRFVITVLVAVVSYILGKVIPVIRFLVSIITAAVNGIHAVFKWLYDVLIGHSIIPDLVRGIQHWLGIMGAAFHAVYAVTIRPVVNAIGSVISTVWSRTIRPAFEAIKTGIGKVADAFRTGANAVKANFEKIMGYTKTPVRWVIDKVINHGILWAWDTLAKWLHLPVSLQIPYLKLPFADGGVVRYYANGGVENHQAQIAPAGAMRVWAEPETGGEAYIPLASSKRGRSTAILGAVANEFGYQLLPFADGGFWSGIGKVASGILGKGLNFAKGALDAIADPVKWIAARLTSPVKRLLGQVDGSNFGRASVAVGEKSLAAMAEAVKKLLGAFSGGSGAQAMVNLALSQVGYHEGPNNSNKYTQQLGRGNGEAWCADFEDWLAMKTGQTSAIPPTASAPGKARAFGSRFQSGTSGIQAGDIVFFTEGQGSIVHTGIAVSPNVGGRWTSVEGNYGDQVVKQTRTGAAGFAHPAYTGGGVASPGGSLYHASPDAAQAWARQALVGYRWGGQAGDLIKLWNRESGWRWNAENPYSGAYGIPQSLPASKMRSAGGDWHDNAATQIKWGLGYIHDRYGSPSAAWAHEINSGWYDSGGMLQPGLTLAYNATRRPEPVLTSDQWAAISAAARGGDGDTYETTYHLYQRDMTIGDLEALQRRQEARQRVGRPH